MPLESKVVCSGTDLGQRDRGGTSWSKASKTLRVMPLRLLAGIAGLPPSVKLSYTRCSPRASTPSAFPMNSGVTLVNVHSIVPERPT